MIHKASSDFSDGALFFYYSLLSAFLYLKSALWLNFTIQYVIIFIVFAILADIGIKYNKTGGSIMKKRIFALILAAAVSAVSFCGCDMLLQEKNDLTDGINDFVGELSGLQDEAEKGKSQLGELLGDVSGISIGGSGSIDMTDKITLASGLSDACAEVYAGIIAGDINSSKNGDMEVSLPEKSASVPARTKAAKKVTIEDVLRYKHAGAADIDGLYYLVKDASDEHQKGHIISDTDDYFSSVSDNAKKLKKATTLGDLYG